MSAAPAEPHAPLRRTRRRQERIRFIVPDSRFGVITMTNRLFFAAVISCAAGVAKGETDEGDALSSPDWPMFRGNARSTGVAQGSLPEKPEVLWSVDVTEPVASTAAIVDDTVYVCDDGGTLHALAVKSGQSLWRHQTGEPIRSSPTVSGGLVFFGDSLGVFHAVDAQTGELRWKYETKAEIVSSANPTQDRVVFGSYEESGQVFQLGGFIHMFAVTGMVLAMAVAIFKYRLYDIDLIINRALVYSLLTLLLTAVFFISVVLIQSLVRLITGQDSPLSIVVSTLLIAALFNPLRRRIQEFIDRRFFRRKYDAVQTLAAFAQTARDEVDLEALTGELTRVVRQTMQPDRISIWLRDPRPSKKRLSFGRKS